MFEDDGTARTKLLSYLGFSVPTKEKDTVEDLSPELKALELDNTITEKAGYGDDKEVNIFPTDNGEDFFNNLSPAGMPVSTSRGENFAIGDTAPDSEQLQQEWFIMILNVVEWFSVTCIYIVSLPFHVDVSKWRYCFFYGASFV